MSATDMKNACLHVAFHAGADEVNAILWAKLAAKRRESAVGAFANGAEVNCNIDYDRNEYHDAKDTY